MTIYTTDQEIGGIWKTDQNWFPNLHDSSCEVNVFPIKGPWWFAYSPMLKKKLESEAQHFDLFHIHGLWLYPTSSATAIAQKYNIPYLITPHGALNQWAMKRSRWKKRLLLALWEGRNIQASSAVHFFNEAEVIDPAMDRLIPKKVFVRNGIDPESLEPRPPSGLFRSRFGLQDKSVVLFLGRIHPVKGLDLLITAFGEVIKKRPDAVMVLAGPDSEGYGKVLERQIKSAGLSQKVIMTGMLTGVDKLAALADADLLVQPSYQEGHSMSVTEALYYGVPVVISKACHMPEVAIHNAGVVVENEPVQLSIALVDLLDDSEKRKTMGEAGKSLARSFYSWDVVAQEMIKVYKELLSARKS